jgi:site-specific recombinase XerD
MNLPRYGEYVFSKENGDKYGNPNTAFQNALKRAGIKNFKFHDLRHTFASQLALCGIDIRTIQELLGHKDIRLTMRYSHLSPGHLQEAVNILGTNLAHSSSRKEEIFVTH